MSSQKWIPEVGKLVSRRMVGECVDEIELIFRDKPDSESHYSVIAVMKNFSTRTSFSGYIEGCTKQVDLSGSGNIIIREYASDLVLRAFARLWDCRSNSLIDWLDAVDQCSQLADEEKKRLRQIFQSSN